MSDKGDRIFGKDDLYRKSRDKIYPFLLPVMECLLKLGSPGKRVLDIGCGPGHWSRVAAESGAMSVDGFDIQVEMVEAARKATSQFSNVTIKLGDAQNMPYDDNAFDLALCIYVTCNLTKDALSKHYQELHLVLAPGGKAVYVNLKNSIYQRLRVSDEADSSAIMQKNISKALSSIPKHPTQQHILDLCNGLGRNVEVACFALDTDGSVFLVNDVKQLTNGQDVWIKFQCLTFPDYFYDEQYLIDQIVASGLHIEKEENYATEEVRVAHNKKYPDFAIARSAIEYPIACMYHLSKPL